MKMALGGTIRIKLLCKRNLLQTKIWVWKMLLVFLAKKLGKNIGNKMEAKLGILIYSCIKYTGRKFMIFDIEGHCKC